HAHLKSPTHCSRGRESALIEAWRRSARTHVRGYGACEIFGLGGVLLFLMVLTSKAGAPLTPAQQRGKTIYLEGVSPSGHQTMGTLPVSNGEVPAVVMRCVNCPGREGRGKPEGAVVPSNITWAALTKPYPLTDGLARPHPAYTERSLKRAVTMG